MAFTNIVATFWSLLRLFLFVLPPRFAFRFSYGAQILDFPFVVGLLQRFRHVSRALKSFIFFFFESVKSFNKSIPIFLIFWLYFIGFSKLNEPFTSLPLKLLNRLQHFFNVLLPAFYHWIRMQFMRWEKS